MTYVVRHTTDLDPSTVVILPVFSDDEFRGFENTGLLEHAPLRDVLRQDLLPSLKYAVTGTFQVEKRPAVLAVQAGKAASFEPLTLMHVAASGSRHLTARGMGDMAVLDRGFFSPCETGRAAVEGIVRGAYDPALRKETRPPERRVAAQSIRVLSARNADEIGEGARLGRLVGECAAVARNLVNLPPNDLTPTILGERAASLAEENGLECEVLGEGEMLDLGMGALLAVSSGSDQPARVIVMRYGNPASPVKLALVGKGMTFDSGGLWIKSHEGMSTMKGDMGGAAAVIAGLLAVAKLAVRNIHVSVYIGSAENMLSGHAMRSGDVVRAMTGETIEVLNTDAEGRLVLADMLAYAQQRGATHLVDFATLTGGAVTALGNVATLATGRPFEWVSRVVACANGAMERCWQMPMFPEYRVAMESEIADIKNTGGTPASALTAAAFLADFVSDIPWAHMDIAGTSWAPDKKAYAPQGGTGVGVGTIVDLVRQLSETGW
ncbi:MAG: leucyl aminopeptidase family protein [Chloroflexota bacterium]|nr:MAG: leucyl aminopeptidase [Chloroflexota bacterium]